MYAGEHFLNTSQSDCNCQNNQEVHYSHSLPTTSASSNADMAPPAPVMAPPVEYEPGLPKTNNMKEQAVDMTTRNRTTAPEPVPLPEIAPEPSSVREFKPIPAANVSPDKEPTPSLKPMPIIDLMSLQMPDRSRVPTHANSDRTIKVETETVTFEPTTVIRKRVQ